jgi:hypothetical protein
MWNEWQDTQAQMWRTILNLGLLTCTQIMVIMKSWLLCMHLCKC